MKKSEVLELNEKKIESIANELSVLLVDLQVFHNDFRNFHRSVERHGFFVLHNKYEEFYNDAAEKVDEVVERILQLGNIPESRFSVYLQISEIKEADVVSCSEEALNLLLDYYRTLTTREHRIIDFATEAHDDTAVSLVNDFLIGREKTV